MAYPSDDEIFMFRDTDGEDVSGVAEAADTPRATLRVRRPPPLVVTVSSRSSSPPAPRKSGKRVLLDASGIGRGGGARRILPRNEPKDDDGPTALPPTFTCTFTDAKVRVNQAMRQLGHDAAVRSTKKPPKYPHYWFVSCCATCKIGVTCISKDTTLNPDLPREWNVLLHDLKSCTAGEFVHKSSVLPAPVPMPHMVEACICCQETLSPSFFTCLNGCKFCTDCLSGSIISQVTGEEQPAFWSKGCKVFCPNCPNSIFLDMQSCAPYLNEEAFQAFVKSIAESPSAMAARQESDANSKLAADSAYHKTPIRILVDTFLQLECGQTCPGCRSPFLYEGGCAAFRCGNCKAHFCMWCRRVTSKEDSHKHPFECDERPNPCETPIPSALFPCSDNDSGVDALQFYNSFFLRSCTTRFFCAVVQLFHNFAHVLL